jgi:hypothetical protein
MTTAEFLALSPRERDAVVAERVLGWKRNWAGFYPPKMPYPGVPSHKLGEIVPDITTSRTDMWLVIDAMRERGFHCQLSIAVEGYGGVGCGFTDMKGAESTSDRYMRLHDLGGAYRFSDCRDELPLAASIAALRAVGHIED